MKPPVTVRITTVLIISLMQGMVMYQSSLKPVAPSILAASYTSCGTDEICPSSMIDAVP